MRFLPRLRTRTLLLAALLSAILPAALSATWSVIAVDRRTGRVVIASATCVAQERLLGFPAKGLMDIQAIVVPGVGVAAAQAGVDRTRSNQQLIYDELKKGTHPEQILVMLQEDPDIERRQFGIVDLQGRCTGFSGSGNSLASLAVQDSVPGAEIVFSVQGNILASDAVVHEAVAAFKAESGSITDRVMAAMEAADAAGGDGRCTCSTEPVPPAPCTTRTSHVAYILAADPDDQEGESFNDGTYSMFVNVTDQDIQPHEDANPVKTLRMRYDAWKAQHGMNDFDGPIRSFADGLAANVAADGVGGVTAAVFQGPNVLWAQGFGYADRDRGTPAGVGTIYRTGSISKTFTALLVAQLADDGTLDLDAPVADALPVVSQIGDAPDGAEPVTYRQLASHTAGWIREPELQGAASGPIGSWEDKVIESVRHTRYYASPGESYRYSNIGFGALGLAASRAARSPFMTLVHQRIIGPLGMEGTTFVLDDRLRARLATGYANGREGVIDAEQPAREHAGRGYKVPNGGVYSTVGDIARFAAALSGHAPVPVLGEALRAEMLEIHTPEDPERGYGLGLSVRTLPDGTVLAGHGGSVAGYTANFVFEPESGLGVVILRNYNRGRTNLGDAAQGLLEELLQRARVHAATASSGG